MKKTKIIAMLLCLVLFITPVLAAETDNFENVVRLGRYSSKIDPESNFREDCILVSVYPVMNEDKTERELTISDFPNLSLSEVKKISVEGKWGTDTYALYLELPGRRQVVEAIVALENDLGVLSEFLCHDRVFPNYAISPWYDDIEPDGRFTNINVERDPTGGYWMSEPKVIVSFYDAPEHDPAENPELVFPEIDVVSVDNSYTYFYGEYAWAVTLNGERRSIDTWRTVYDALKKLNGRDDIKDAFGETYAVGETTEARYSKSDYSKDDWFFPHMTYVLERAWMKTENYTYTFITEGGYEYWGTMYNFYPEMSLTRGMLVTILHRMAGTPEAVSSVDFVDTILDTWYSKAVSWAVDTGLTVGVGGKYFAPERAVTREEFATLMYRYHTLISGSPVRYSTAADCFTDGDELSAWAEEAMSWAVGNLLFVGRDGGLLAPASPITRAECAKVLARYDDYVPKK